MNTQLAQEHKTNRRFLYQAMLTATPCIIAINTYTFGISLILTEISRDLCMAMNPFVYLWFNSALRGDLLVMLRCKDNPDKVMWVIKSDVGHERSVKT
jgi:exonuclease I